MCICNENFSKEKFYHISVWPDTDISACFVHYEK